MMKTTGMALLVLGLILAVVGGTSRRAPAQAPRSDKEMTLDLGGGVTMELVLIQPGSFPMGSNTPKTEESPVHQVTISKPFYMGKYTVTQKQWEAVMGSTISSYFKGPDNPADGVSWDDCQVFLRKLGEKVGGGRTFALPTEAQWEYACRAGSTAKFYHGDDEARLGDYAWFVGNSGGKTHPVGQKKPNAWGLYDMHGNIMEWCEDWYGQYPTGEVTDPTGGQNGSLRVLRGGQWNAGSGSCRSAGRGRIAPENRHSGFGIRVAMAAAGVD
jgi:formylglycine-generating enzyme required for sulfatase activity